MSPTVSYYGAGVSVERSERVVMADQSDAETQAVAKEYINGLLGDVYADL